jgi:phosphoribosylamine--glycine ligase
VDPEALIFHAGTRRVGDTVTTAGGRVLTVVGCGDTLAAAHAHAYANVARIRFPGMHYRTDIGKSAV